MSALPAEVGRIVYTIFPDTSARKKYELAEQWSEIVTRIKDPKVAPEKSALRLISMGVYGDQRSDKAALRHAGNLLAITGVEGDYDGKVVPLEDAAERIGLAGIKAVFYTTPSHAPDAPKWRILAPLSREYPPSERARFLARINGILGGILADESFTLSQSFYIGRVEGREYEVIDLDGDCIDQRDEFDATAIMPKGKSTADGGRTDETTDAEHRANILTGKQFHQSLRALSSRLIGRGMPPTDVEAVLVGLMQESTERGTERWRERLAEIPRLVESAAAKFRDPRREGEAPEPPDDDRWAPPEGDEDIGHATDRGAVPAAISIVSALDAAIEATLGEWLLRPYLEADVLALMYGDYGTLKSFIALDWCLRISLGLPALGHHYERDPQPVVYISAEGKGLWKRLRAWCIRNRRGEDWREVLQRSQLHCIRRPVNLSAAQEVVHLASAIEQLGIKPVLVVVDTLSRNSDGEPEKSTDSATSYLNNLDTGLRVRFGATVLFIHHVGHGDKERHRGPIVLASNTDAELRVSRPDRDKLEVTLEVVRLKDSDLPTAVGLKGVVVELGEVDRDGKEITSLAIEGMAETPATARQATPAGKNQRELLAAIRGWQANGKTIVTRHELHELAKGIGIKKWDRRDAAIAGLEQRQLLTPTVGGFLVAP